MATYWNLFRAKVQAWAWAENPGSVQLIGRALLDALVALIIFGGELGPWAVPMYAAYLFCRYQKPETTDTQMAAAVQPDMLTLTQAMQIYDGLASLRIQMFMSHLFMWWITVGDIILQLCQRQHNQVQELTRLLAQSQAQVRELQARFNEAEAQGDEDNAELSVMEPKEAAELASSSDSDSDTSYDEGQEWSPEDERRLIQALIHHDWV